MIQLGRMAYREAYDLQAEHVEEVIAARGATVPANAPPAWGRLLLVEHDPVVTISRRKGAEANLLADEATLAAAGVAVEPTDRGGDITYHGPGQLVAYPILDLNVLMLRLHDYMRLLEQSVIDTLEAFGVEGRRDPDATGVWVELAKHQSAAPEGQFAKIAAMGVRVRRWVSMHGLSLNVDPDPAHFRLIVPCGLAGRPVTSLRALLGDECPSMERVSEELVGHLHANLAQAAARAAAHRSPT